MSRKLIFRTLAGFIFIAFSIALPAMGVDFSQEPSRLGRLQVYSIAFSPDGTILAAWHQAEQAVRLWDVETQKQVGALKKDLGTIYTIAFSPDGKLLALGGSKQGLKVGKTIRLWDVAGQNQVGVMQSPTNEVYSVAFSPDGKTLASSGYGENVVRLWDVQTQQQVGELRGHTQEGVYSVAFSPDGRLLFSGGWLGDEAIRVWDVQTQKQVGELIGHLDTTWALAFSPDGKILASAGGGRDKAVYLWDFQAQTRVGVLGGHSAHVGSIAFSPDGKLLASTVFWDDTVHFWDVKEQKQVGVLRGHDASDMGWFDQVAFSPDGTWLACGSENGVELWELNLPGGAYAFRPRPTDKATDVPWDVVLKWTPGIYAPPVNGHRVYFSESFNDVNDGIGAIAQDAGSYTPAQHLDFDKTYYWRVDEVNEPPDYTVYEGDVWSFTTEPVGYPMPSENITATASSRSRGSRPENTVNGSGLDDSGLLHGKGGDGMWLSDGAGPQPTWIEYELDKVYKLHQMWVWNSNQMVEPHVGLGFKDVTIEYSTNGTDYTTLGTTHEFARAPGTAGYAHNTTIDFGGAAAKYVRLTANSNWGDIMPQYGLSEVRFFYIPLRAREPSPDSGATDVDLDVTLSFRAGREAAQHDVYLGTDEQVVIDGTAPVTTISQASHGPLSLDLGTTYYWKVNEVNEAASPRSWEGDVWNFATREFIVVDDFEAYNNLDPDVPESNRIFHAWIDGYEQPTNGSIVGYAEAPFTEQSIVHGGNQSMPLLYDNTGGAAYSEAERTFAVGWNWAEHGVKTLSLWFSGATNNVAAQMYVKLNGSKVTYDGDANNLTRIPWQTWNIDLASFGVNLGNVTELSIGLERNGAVGGTGVIYLDDIRLYPYSRQFVTPIEPDQANLAAHWQFEGNFDDSSGNGRHGTARGSPTFVAGKIGQAVNLGTGDFVEITGYKGVVGDGSETPPWSVTAWVRTNIRNGEVVGWGSAGRSNSMEFRIGGGGTHVNTSGGATHGNTRINDGQWHHIAVTVQPNSVFSSGIDLWVDGQLNTRPSGNPNPWHPIAGFDVKIGIRYNGRGRQFTGAIDDVRIYNRALSDAEVAGLAGRTEPFDKPF